MEKDVCFENHIGERLFGTLHTPEKPSSCGVVLGHCFTCTRHTGILRELGARLMASGFHVLRFDFSGNGQSEGAFIESSYSKYIVEMGIAADFMRANGVSWLGLAGHSMGAAISVLAAKKIKGVQAVCTIAGRLTSTKNARILSDAQRLQLEETGRVSFVSRGRRLELDRRFLTDLLSHDMPQTVASFDMPLLIVHGTLDEIVPVDQAQKAHETCAFSRLLLVPGADHFFTGPDCREQVAQQIATWFVSVKSQSAMP